MKKYITGITAIMIAIAAAAFTSPSKSITDVTFVYNPPSSGDYSQSSVQDKANWSTGTMSCDAVKNKACELQVLTTDTKNHGTELGDNVSITAALGGIPGDYFVSGGSHIQSETNQQ